MQLGQHSIDGQVGCNSKSPERYIPEYVVMPAHKLNMRADDSDGF